MAGDIEEKLRVELTLGLAKQYCIEKNFHLAYVSALNAVNVDKTLCEFARDVCKEKGYRKRDSADLAFDLQRDWELSRKAKQYAKDTESGVPPQQLPPPVDSGTPLSSTRSTIELILSGEPVDDPGCCAKCIVGYLECIASCVCCELSWCRDEPDDL
jgi:hypothetical protein